MKARPLRRRAEAGSSPRSVLRLVTVALALGSLIALIAGSVGIGLAIESRSASESALATLLPASSTANQLLATVVDQETGERGYVITAEPRFLQPFEEGVAATPGLVAKLRGELVGRSQDLRLLSGFVARYERWETTYASSQIRDVQRGDASAAIEAEKSGRGKTLFDALRSAMSALDAQLAAEERGLASRVRNLEAATIWLVAAVTGFALLGAGIGRGLIRRWVVGPIHDLDEQVALVADGDIDHALHPSGPFEISSLGTNLERMRGRVRRQTVEIAEQRTIAETLQRALLPRELPTPPGFEIAARYLPGAEHVEIGGDWFNLRVAGGRRSFLAVGDVSGRGVAAAGIMASLRYAINAYAAEDPRPDVVLERLSRLFLFADEARFATVLCALFDAEAGELLLASAGHPPPVVVRSGRAELAEIAVGPPIGLGVDHYRARSIPVEPGTTLVAFTDGLVERRGESITEGLERLRAATVVGDSLEVLADRLFAELVPEGTDDDVVIVAARWWG